MGFSTKKAHNKTEDKGIAYILAAKREAKKSRERRAKPHRPIVRTIFNEGVRS